jgi:hypothetical protein
MGQRKGIFQADGHAQPHSQVQGLGHRRTGGTDGKSGLRNQRAAEMHMLPGGFFRRSQAARPGLTGGPVEHQADHFAHRRARHQHHAVFEIGILHLGRGNQDHRTQGAAVVWRLRPGRCAGDKCNDQERAQQERTQQERTSDKHAQPRRAKTGSPDCPKWEADCHDASIMG